MKRKMMMALLVGASTLLPLAGSANAGEAPLISFYCKQRDDNFAGDPVTIRKVGGDWKEGKSFTAKGGVVYEQKETLCKVLTEAVDGQTVALKVFYSDTRDDNCIATELVWQGKDGEGEKANMKSHGYVHYYTAGHVYKANDAAKSRVPLKLWYHEARKDSALAVSSGSKDEEMATKGYKDQGIIGYGL